jgi:hypothetical protein
MKSTGPDLCQSCESASDVVLITKQQKSRR